MSWTDDRVELLTKLWTEGKTAAEIAKTLGGVTRNAVIGKAHRLKLSNRVSPIQQNKKPAAPANTQSAPAPKAEKKKAKEIVEERPTGDGIQLMDLGPRMCRWPSGDPREEGFGFCGCKSMSGLPYCEEHAKIAYQAATRNKIMKSKEEDKEVAQVQEQLKKVANA